MLLYLASFKEDELYAYIMLRCFGHYISKFKWMEDKFCFRLLRSPTKIYTKFLTISPDIRLSDFVSFNTFNLSV